MKKLTLYNLYDREDINKIFNPSIPFKPGTGTWGMHGLINVPNRPNDFIFLISLGQKKLGYDFSEKISSTGQLVWQSQPKQKLSDKKILKLIEHNEELDHIYLFIRNFENEKRYLYLGNLAYISHDLSREAPVHFKWQIIEWNTYTISKLAEIDINLKLEIEGSKQQSNSLYLTDSPSNYVKKNKERNSPTNQESTANYSVIHEANRVLGATGEELVLNNEKKYLLNKGRKDLADKIEHISRRNDSAGYDILSYESNGRKKLIEVKTTTGGINSGFYISSNEVATSKENQDEYYIYRVYDFDKEKQTGNFYMVKGSIENNFNLEPTNFKANYSEKNIDHNNFNKK